MKKQHDWVADLLQHKHELAPECDTTTVVDTTDCRLPFGGCALCNPEQIVMKSKLGPKQRLPREVVEQLEQLNRDRERMLELQETVQSSSDYLSDVLAEHGYDLNDLVTIPVVAGTLEAKRQPSFKLERRPGASQKALDEVFERIPYSYVKTTIVPPRRQVLRKRS